MTVHSVLAQRAGFSIDWSSTEKEEYLDALTKELDSPGNGYLDNYLKPFMRRPTAYEQLTTEVARAPGFDGSAGPPAEPNEVLGDTNEPGVKTLYEEVLLKRKQK